MKAPEFLQNHIRLGFSFYVVSNYGDMSLNPTDRVHLLKGGLCFETEPYNRKDDEMFDQTVEL